MSSITGSVRRPTINLELPALQNISSELPISVQGLSRVAKAIGTGLYAAFIPMFTAYFIARALGASALCYDDLHLQAATAGAAMLPFSVFAILVAGNRSVRATFTVGAFVSAVFGILLAAMV
jgi:hypothetical protein